MNKITKTCERCKQPFEIDDQSGDRIGEIVMRMQRNCSVCSELNRKEFDASESAKAKAARESEWHEVCPPLYRNTDPRVKALNTAFLNAAADWDPRGTQGLGFMGPSRTGKTRLLYMALRHAFEAGRSLAAISHIDFCEQVLTAVAGPDDQRRYQADKTIDRLRNREVLLLDDVGKAPTSPQRDAQLYSLLEYRASQGLPVLWCSNGHGQWLVDRFGMDRGAPIVARLAEFSNVVKVGAE